jgi:hypothetical protein
MTSSPGLFRENLFRPSGLRIISIVDELHGSAPQNDANARSFQVMGKRKVLGVLDCVRRPSRYKFES